MKENKIEITGWELLDAYPIFEKIVKQRLVTTKGVYNLLKVIKLAGKVIFDEKLIDIKNDLVKKYAEEKKPDDTSTIIRLDPGKVELFYDEANVIFNKVFTIDYSPVDYSLLEDSKLELSMDELIILEKFIVQN